MITVKDYYEIVYFNDGSDIVMQAAQNAVSARIKLFWALSRTPHGLLDMATPAAAALIWMGAFPPVSIIVLGLITTFAGYTAVYALNDVVDHKTDQEKLAFGGNRENDNYLDAVMIRHPLAQGALTRREAVGWTLAWAALAVIGAYLLNPVCLIIFAVACLLESIYCLLLKISHFRTLVSGAVKTSGAVAAIYAVDPEPSLLFVFALFLWLFFWEIGGQNVPADWADVEQDRRLRARTIPVIFGPQRATVIVIGALVMTVLLNQLVFGLAGYAMHPFWRLIALGVGVYLLLVPALNLYRSRNRVTAMALFNKASYYPVAMLLVAVFGALY
jgi:4-hydroxybenzoate polyprenyltransferase